jgi:formiminotetrahydrofolate cyclodeaminase
MASDLRIAIDLAAVGARAAQENVRINLPSLADESERAAVSSRTEAMLSRIDAAAAALIARV